MKDDIIMYGVCAAISIAAVAITSIVKLIVCSIAKKMEKDVSSNAKEYLFTPLALVLSAIGLYIWLDRFVNLENDEKFILIVACFSVGTMLIYWLLFQILLKARFSLSMKSSAMSFVKHNGGSRRRMFVEAQPVKQCWV